MNAPEDMTRIIARRRYSTATATLLADDAYWDGSNFERSGRNTFLYRTPNGNYFTVTLTQWQGERNRLDDCDIADAIALYEGPLHQHHVEYADAFPGVTVEDA